VTEALREEQLEDGGRVLPDSRLPDSWNEQAVVQAYLTHSQDLLRFAATMLAGNIQSATDVVHDTFLIVLAQWKKIRDPEMIRAWMFSILRNECLRRLTRDTRTVNIDAVNVIGLLPTLESAESEALANLESSAVSAAVRQLPPRQQQALTLSMTGHTTAEIANRLGIDANAVRVNLHHARRKIKALLDSGALAI